MDTLTHALFGAVCAAAATRTFPGKNRALARHMAITGIAAAFPDIDYLGFWIDPLLFLADWHRGATHSLLLIPIWAVLLTICALPWSWARQNWRILYALCALGIFTHIPLDLLTPFGTKIFYPLSSNSYSLGTTFFIDGYFTALLVTTLFILFWHPTSKVALGGLITLSAYLGGQWLLKTQALQVAADQFPESVDLYAIPQPFSPFYWQLIKRSGEHYQVAYLSLLSQDSALVSSYRAPGRLQWQHHHLLGKQDLYKPLIREAWQQDQMQKFRDFTQFPVLYRLDRSEGETCIWFTDLRYTLPYLTPPFRYGMCRNQEALWKVYRLKRFTANERQLL
jgi:inner membrane protein